VFDGLVEPGLLPLETAVERMTSGCEAFGFPAPRIKQGEAANIVLFDPSAEWVVGQDGWASTSANSCFAGRSLKGRVVTTIVEGVVVFGKGGVM
jgi:dihydroorotase